MKESGEDGRKERETKKGREEEYGYEEMTKFRESQRQIL